MSKSSILTVEEYVIVVKLPSSIFFVYKKDRTLADVEKFFEEKRDKDFDSNRKVEFDRVRALLKYASCFNAVLRGVETDFHDIVISLGFKSHEEMLKFRDTMEEAVEGAIIK